MSTVSRTLPCSAPADSIHHPASVIRRIREWSSESTHFNCPDSCQCDALCCFQCIIMSSLGSSRSSKVCGMVTAASSSWRNLGEISAKHATAIPDNKLTMYIGWSAGTSYETSPYRSVSVDFIILGKSHKVCTAKRVMTNNYIHT